MATESSQDDGRVVDAVVVGAGFAGLYALHRLKRTGFSVQGFETGGDVGGTWYWNRYPGSRCDTESICYSYSFDEDLEQEWNWTEVYATQPEIQRYLSHVADRFNLRPLIDFHTSVEILDWIDSKQRWRVCTNRGGVVEARFVILATGPLSAAKHPDIAGVDDFKGELIHTSSWPERDVQLAGKRVAVIGTGSSAVQSIPLIAQEAAQVTVFQRTPVFSTPAGNRPLSPEENTSTKANYRNLREQWQESHTGFAMASTGRAALATPEDERAAIFEQAWQLGGFGVQVAFTDVSTNTEANDLAADFVRRKIHKIVRDPSVAESLSPRDYPLGAKRMNPGTDYYETFNRDNVVLKDLRKEPLRRIVSNGVETQDGVTEADVLILALGFDAVTGSFLRIQITGTKGQTLAEKWKAGPRTYLGLMSHGFPNLFFVLGPGSPSVLSNMVLSIEQHVEWIGDCMGAMRSCELVRIEPTEEAEDEWVAKVDTLAAKTLFSLADSWYVGSNIPGKPRVLLAYVAGVSTYRKICDNVVANGYDGFMLSKS